MKRYLYILLFVFIIKPSFGQDNKYFGKPIITPIPEVMAEYPGGNVKLHQFITGILPYQQNDPDCYYSKVVLMFDVDENGKVTNPDCYVKETGTCTKIEEFKTELKTKLLTMPDWKPAQTNGKNVKMRMNYPVTICWR